MRQVSIIITFIVFANVTYSQISKKDTLIPMTSIIKRLSYYWQLDSLAGNGFRLYTCDQLLKSKLDQVSQSFLVQKLGKPNELRSTNHGWEYVYYYFDIKAMPKDYDAPLTCSYIAFRFKTHESYVTEIIEGDIDR